MKKVNILGTAYKVYLNVPYIKDPNLSGAYGYTDFHSKRILVSDIHTVPGWEEASGEAAWDTYSWYAQSMGASKVEVFQRPW